MFTVKSHNIGQNTSRMDLTNYIQDSPITDIYNSVIMEKLDKFPEYKSFKITKNEYRIDKISEEIYSDSNYGWIILYINKCSIDDLVIGKLLYYIEKSKLDNLINNL